MIYAYWDDGTCGPTLDDANMDWCYGTGCMDLVTDLNQCASHQATLDHLYGDDTGTEWNWDNPDQIHTVNGCKFGFFAVYKCVGNQTI